MHELSACTLSIINCVSIAALLSQIFRVFKSFTKFSLCEETNSQKAHGERMRKEKKKENLFERMS